MTALHHQARQQLIDRFDSLHHEHPAYRWWVLANVMIGTFMAVLDATIVNVGLPKIMTSFGVSIDKVEWVITAYMLIFAIMLPTSGWIADHYGYKRTYFAALGLFTLGSFLCGLSWSENTLIFFRVIQGTGAGLMMPVGMAIITREFPLEQRGMALGFWGIAAAASVSLGPLLGGYLIDNLSWQSIFYINVPVGVLGMLATLIVQREYKTESTRSFDILGFLGVAVFLGFLQIALSDANAAWNIGGWSSPFILTCIGLSLLGLIVFLATELRVEHPLIELKLLSNFNFAITNGILFIFGLGMFGSTFLLPLYLQNSLGYTALQAGMVFLPVGFLQGLFSPISGMMSDKLNPKVPAIIGVILLAVSMYLNSSLSLSSEHYQIMLPLYLRGLAMGIVFTPLSSIAMSEIPKQKMAQASGLFNVIRQIGGSLGVAILGTILSQRVIYHTAILGQSVDQTSPVFQQAMKGLQGFARGMAGGTTADATLRAQTMLGTYLANQAFVRAINDDFMLTALITILGVIPIFLLRTPKKDKSAAGPHPMAD